MANTLISIATVLAALGPGSEPSAPCNESIRQQDVKADLYFLAGDAFQGRLTGTAGNNLAAEFIGSRFERLGLKRVGSDGSYFQPFLLSTATLGSSNKLEVTRDDVTLRFRAGQDFVPLPFSPSAEVLNSLAFAGFGISDPERGHDDYRNVDVRDKIVLVLAHEPGENDPKSPFDGLVMSEASTPLRKVMTAQEKGAVGILIVSDVHNHPEPENFEALAHGLWPEKPPRILQYTLQDWAERVRIPVAMISTGLARTLLRGAKSSFEAMARSSERPQNGSNGMIEGARITLATDVSRHVVPDRNVVAALEGCDPKLKDEWVVISCHLDHNGADGDRIYNGADDNGSGTVGLLEIASLTRTIEQSSAPFGLTLKQDLDNNVSNLLLRSDHWPFLQRGVPAVFFHTGLHPDYHTPADRPEKIEYAKMERIVRLVHQASWDLAQQADRPKLEHETAPATSR